MTVKDFILSVKENTSISEDNLSKIYHLRFIESKSIRTIAKEINVSKSTINRILNLQRTIKNEKARYLRKYVIDRKGRKNKEEKYKIKDKIYNKRKNRKMSAIRMITKEVFKENTIGIKYIWEAIGLWSRKYDLCVECNTTVYKHYSKGMCYRCYTSLNYKGYTSEKRNNEYFRQRYKRRKLKYKLALEKVESGEIEMTPKIKNLMGYIKG